MGEAPRGYFPFLPFSQLEAEFWSMYPICARQGLDSFGNTFTNAFQAAPLSSNVVRANVAPRMDSSRSYSRPFFASHVDLPQQYRDLSPAQHKVPFLKAAPPLFFDEIQSNQNFQDWSTWAKQSWDSLNDARKQMKGDSKSEEYFFPPGFKAGSSGFPVSQASSSTNALRAYQVSRSFEQPRPELPPLSDINILFDRLRLNQNQFTKTVMLWDFLHKYGMILCIDNLISNISLEALVRCVQEPLKSEHYFLYCEIMAALTRAAVVDFERIEKDLGEGRSFEEHLENFLLKGTESAVTVGSSIWNLYLKNWMQDINGTLPSNHADDIENSQLNEIEQSPQEKLITSLCESSEFHDGFHDDEWFANLTFEQRLLLLDELISSIIDSKRFRKLFDLYSSSIHFTSRKIYARPPKNAYDREKSAVYGALEALNAILPKLGHCESDDSQFSESYALAHLDSFVQEQSEKRKDEVRKRQQFPIRPTCLGRDRLRRSYWFLGDEHKYIYVVKRDQTWSCFKTDAFLKDLMEGLDVSIPVELHLRKELDRLDWYIQERSESPLQNSIGILTHAMIEKEQSFLRCHNISESNGMSDRCSYCSFLTFGVHECSLKRNFQGLRKLAPETEEDRIEYRMFVAKVLMLEIENVFTCLLARQEASLESFNPKRWRKSVVDAPAVHVLYSKLGYVEGKILRSYMVQRFQRVQWRDELEECESLTDLIRLIFELDHAIRWEHLDRLESEGEESAESSIESEDDGSSSDEEDCEICGASEGDTDLIICDECDLYFHLSCLDPPLLEAPSGQWFCSTCLNKRRSRVKQRKRRR